jgi:hypothetical protein
MSQWAQKPRIFVRFREECGRDVCDKPQVVSGVRVLGTCTEGRNAATAAVIESENGKDVCACLEG